jgi:hypothetical protein
VCQARGETNKEDDPVMHFESDARYGRVWLT